MCSNKKEDDKHGGKRGDTHDTPLPTATPRRLCGVDWVYQAIVANRTVNANTTSHYVVSSSTDGHSMHEGVHGSDWAGGLRRQLY